MKYLKCMHFKHKHMDYNVKIRGHHASKFAIIYSNGGHIGFNYTHTSLNQVLTLKICWSSCPNRSMRTPSEKKSLG